MVLETMQAGFGGVPVYAGPGHYCVLCISVQTSSCVATAVLCNKQLSVEQACICTILYCAISLACSTPQPCCGVDCTLVCTWLFTLVLLVYNHLLVIELLLTA
eukprot:GHRR01027344.1.p2 GENE.GHRR01027344.1~~GHRR01027344.1.p2  ORF type:complete len:103 (+),score=4.28 GHRR01027344.1:295-603(+)